MPLLVTGGALRGPLLDDLMRTGRTDAEALPRGTRLGAYAVTDEIGRGGEGVVYAAERADGTFEQSVAIKVLRTGARVRSRFLAERITLGRLRHAHIVRILDAGESHDGLLWYAMERVEGERLDRWAATQRPDWRTRVALLMQICAAVEFAHRQLVVHGDLTPANVLVSADAAPHVLDFGIARRLDQAPASAATFTPGYASPEHLDGTPLGTTADVFQLGRLIERLFTLDALPATPAATAHSLRAIAGRATDTAAERRHGSVAELRAELQRVLQQRPPLASPLPLDQRTALFLARQRRTLAIGSAATLLLGAGVFFHLDRVAAEHARAEASARRTATVGEFMIELFRSGDAGANGGVAVVASELLARGLARVERDYAREPALHADLLLAIGSAYLNIGELAKAEPLLLRAHVLRAATPEIGVAEVGASLEALALLRHRQGRFDEALVLENRGLVLYGDEALHAPARAAMLNRRGITQKARGALDRALVDFDEAFALATSRDPEGELVARIANNRGLARMQAGRQLDARTDFERALELHAKRYGEDHPNWTGAAANLAWLLGEMHDFVRAEPLIRKRLASSARVYGERSAEYANDLNVLGGLLKDEGRITEAIPVFERAAEIWQAALGDSHPGPTHPLHNLAVSRHLLGEHPAALEMLDRVIARRVRLLGPVHADIAEARRDRGDMLAALSRTAEARASYEQALAIYDQVAAAPNRGRDSVILRLEALAATNTAAISDGARPLH